MLFEIRNYYKTPDQFEAYKEWAKNEAIPYIITQKINVVGFWVNTSDEPVVNGESMDKLGSANITWILKWRDMAHRNEVLPRVLASPEFQDIFSRVPGGHESYLRSEVKFAESLI